LNEPHHADLNQPIKHIGWDLCIEKWPKLTKRVVTVEDAQLDFDRWISEQIEKDTKAFFERISKESRERRRKMLPWRGFRWELPKA